MISVVLPARDEREAIVGTIEAIQQVSESSGIDMEVLVVDDGSEDETAELAGRCGARVIGHPQSAGYGRSLKDGIVAATHDTIVICDADGTYPAAAIPELLAEYEKGIDMVVGLRTPFRDSFPKAALRHLLRRLVQYTTGRDVPDVNSGLRVFSRKTIIPYLQTLSDSFSFTTSATLAYLMTGRFVGYVPISYKARKGRSKVRLVRDSLRTFQYIVHAIIYYNPLKLFALLSLICVALAMLGFLASAVLDLLSGFLLGIGGLLVAVIIICFGLLAELLRQILSRQSSG